MVGTIGILNVGAGDTKLTFDPKNPAEVARSAKIVTDMIRRGFVLLIQIGENDKGPIYQRAHGFDETTAEYIIAGDPPVDTESKSVKKPASAPRRGRKAASHRVPAAKTSAVAVARTAGG